MKKNLASTILRESGGKVLALLALHGRLEPSKDEWDVFCQQAEEARDAGVLTSVVVTDGGGPNAAQRKRVVEIAGELTSRNALVTTSRTVRFMGTAMVWLSSTMDVEFFAPEAFALAATHVRLDPVVLLDAFATLERELGDASLTLTRVRAR